MRLKNKKNKSEQRNQNKRKLKKTFSLISKARKKVFDFFLFFFFLFFLFFFFLLLIVNYCHIPLLINKIILRSISNKTKQNKTKKNPTTEMLLFFCSLLGSAFQTKKRFNCASIVCHVCAWFHSRTITLRIFSSNCVFFPEDFDVPSDLDVSDLITN